MILPETVFGYVGVLAFVCIFIPCFTYYVSIMCWLYEPEENW